MIRTNSQFTTSYNNYNARQSSRSSVAFSGYGQDAANIAGHYAESGLKKTGLSIRRAISAVGSFIYSKKISQIHDLIAPIGRDSKEQMEAVSYASHLFAHNKETEINLESGRIADIAKSDESCIFIMNHNSPVQDPAMAGVFSAFLHSEYQKAGKAETAPRLRFFLSEELLKGMDKRLQDIFEKLGATGVDASLFPSIHSGSSNARKILPSVREFIQGKSNIFIFPEGKMYPFKGLDLKQRFQAGVAGIVQKATEKKERVKVVPIGFAYDDPVNSKFYSIHVGEPIYFRKHNDEMMVTRGNVPQRGENPLVYYFNGVSPVDYRPLTDNGMVVDSKKSTPYIAGILCENLRICKDAALKALPTASLGGDVIRVAQ